MDINIEMSNQQCEMMMMAENKVFAPLFVAGYGAGKSFVLVYNAVRDVLSFYGCKVGVYAPTYDLLSLNLIPAVEQYLDHRNIRHVLNKKEHILYLEGSRKIIFRSLDNPSKIVAYETYRAHVDEADLMTTAEKSEEAWNRVIARNRQKHIEKEKHFNMVSAYSTPESYRFTYKRWKKSPGQGYQYVVAPTRSNWTLDDSYIQNLEDTYTPEQCKAYLEGIWTNIFTGSVYSYYDRDKHNTNREIQVGDILHIGQDFNYGGSCGAVFVCEGNSMYLVDEYAAHDTYEIKNIIRERYFSNRIIFYPDATGTRNTSNASESDIAILKGAGYQVKAKGRNPRITDRVNAVQRLFYNNRLFINAKKCPQTATALEEHAYSKITGLPEKVTGPATIDDRMDSLGYPIAYLHPIHERKTTSFEFPI